MGALSAARLPSRARNLASPPALQARLFAFCRAHGGTRALSRALASALALHPTQAGLWSYAAAWELRCRRDVTAARALMQRGLRACPRNGGLLADYFGLEVAAAELLRARAEALGTLDGPGQAAAGGGGGVRGGAGGPPARAKGRWAGTPPVSRCARKPALARRTPARCLSAR